MTQAAVEAGAPEGLIHCMTYISLPGTNELLSHRHTAVILATGGSAMVRAAHSQGKPAYGVGPGNVPVYVDRSADLEHAARYIVASKAFDYSVICATEQSVVADRPIAARLEELMKAEGAYFMDEAQTEACAIPSSHRMAASTPPPWASQPRCWQAWPASRFPAMPVFWWPGCAKLAATSRSLAKNSPPCWVGMRPTVGSRAASAASNLSVSADAATA